MEETYLTCSKCGGTMFSFRWEWKDNNQYNRMYMCHDGLGLELSSAYMKCESCGKITEPENTYED